MCPLGTLPLQLARNSITSVQCANCDEVSFTACKEVCWNSIAWILGMFITDSSGVEIWKISRCVVVQYLACLLHWWWFMSAADLYSCQYVCTAAVYPVWVSQHKPVSMKVHIVPFLPFLHIYPQLLRLSHVVCWSCYSVSMYIEISIFRVHNVKRVCGQIYLRNVNKCRIVRVSVPIRWWPLPIGYPFTFSTPPPPILMLWAAWTNDAVELTARVALYVITNYKWLLVIKWTWSKKSKESWQWTCEMLNACCETPWVAETCWWRTIMCDWPYL
jgi:hypothetical protein